VGVLGSDTSATRAETKGSGITEQAAARGRAWRGAVAVRTGCDGSGFAEVLEGDSDGVNGEKWVGRR
jgi:hypothetical protein